METENRPWGSFTVLLDALTFKVKTITIKPGKRLSLQKHEKRREHWFVVRGLGVVILDENEITIRDEETINIPVGAVHRMANIGENDLVFVEVQTGTYFGEDDIIRIEDDFGRTI
jgi:mannose-6-phosphate isomerase